MKIVSSLFNNNDFCAVVYVLLFINSDAKAACWKDALDDILPEHHTMHAPIRRCIDTYKTAAAGLMKKRGEIVKT